MNLYSTLLAYENLKNLGSNEGSRGIENLCKLVRAMGYRDCMNRMQFRDGCLGDLIEFFEDNPGAIEAVKEWIGKQKVDEWRESLQSELPLKDCYEGGECPDCGEPIPDDAEEGSNCSNCEHVFWFNHPNDDD